jgi:hypothetical protein
MNGAHRLSRTGHTDCHDRTGVAGKAGRTPGSYVSLSLLFRQSLQNQAVLPQFHSMHTCLLRATKLCHPRMCDRLTPAGSLWRCLRQRLAISRPPRPPRRRNRKPGAGSSVANKPTDLGRPPRSVGLGLYRMWVCRSRSVCG